MNDADTFLRGVQECEWHHLGDERKIPMAVLIEAISVIFRKERIEENFPGGWTGFLDEAPNRTLFSDCEIGCIGFMHPDDVHKYVFYLESFGLDFDIGGQTKDIAVADQIRGFTIPSPWLSFGELDKDGNAVKASWLASGEPGFVFTRRGWQYEGSLSQKSGFVASEDVDDKVRFLRNENGLDVYLNLETGKEVYLGRPEIQGEDKQDVFERLRAICNEALTLEAETEVARRSKDVEQGGINFSRLVTEILPEVENISHGVGRNMSFAHFAKGLVLRILKQPESAETCFRRANELQPDVSNTLLELVRCLGEQGKHEDALPFAQKAVKCEPDSPAALGNLAMTLFLLGDKKEARITGRSGKSDDLLEPGKMNEADTRAELIEPQLRASGWGENGSRILREYRITAGKIRFGCM